MPPAQTLRTIGAAAAALFLASCSGEQPVEYNLSNVTGKMPDLEFRLTDPGGTTRTAEDFRGKAVLVYFGFTHCPDACPMTLGRIRSALQRLPSEAAERTAVLLVTVDPQRDTPERLRSYLARYEMPQLTGLRGTGKELEDLMERYHVHAELRKEGPDDTDYNVDHSSQVFVFGPEGRARLMGRFAGAGPNTDSPEALAEDLKEIL